MSQYPSQYPLQCLLQCFSFAVFTVSSFAVFTVSSCLCCLCDTHLKRYAFEALRRSFKTFASTALASTAFQLMDCQLMDCHCAPVHCQKMSEDALISFH
ncbi:hypothetical protein AB6D20_028035 (plasmid) [Vibrio splendidus]